ncbi:unnamed protein product [Lactuca saligna]|uniref:Uncharacterized protein n=1 Tax=Lactuca saligna TaxID=75948 RepID=A0AA36A0E8_LACSI|nr:unnamed protein product [Lactuca saligna]
MLYERMYRLMMLVVHSTASHEWLDQVTVKYHLVEEDGVVLHDVNVITNRPPPGKLNASCFHYRNEFHLPGMIDDQKLARISDLSQDIDKISCLNVTMKKFPEAVLGKVGMAPYGLRLGIIPSLFVRGVGDGDDGTSEQPLIQRKRDIDFATSVAMAAILSC